MTTRVRQGIARMPPVGGLGKRKRHHRSPARARKRFRTFHARLPLPGKVEASVKLSVPDMQNELKEVMTKLINGATTMTVEQPTGSEYSALANEMRDLRLRGHELALELETKSFVDVSKTDFAKWYYANITNDNRLFKSPSNAGGAHLARPVGYGRWAVADPLVAGRLRFIKHAVRRLPRRLGPAKVRELKAELKKIKGMLLRRGKKLADKKLSDSEYSKLTDEMMTLRVRGRANAIALEHKSSFEASETEFGKWYNKHFTTGGELRKPGQKISTPHLPAPGAHHLFHRFHPNHRGLHVRRPMFGRHMNK